MINFTIEQIFSLIIAFTSVLLAIYLITARNKNYLSNLLLASFLLVNAQDSSGMLASYFIYPEYPGWGMIVNATVFFKMPLLYLYVLSVVYSDFKLRWIHLLHLLPFLINAAVLIPRFYAVDFDAKWDFLIENRREPLNEIKFSYVLVHAQILGYFLVSFIQIARYRKLLLENFSNTSLFNYTWLFQFLTLFALDSLVATFKNIFMFWNIESAYAYTHFATGLFTLIFICWIVLKALHHPELFKGISSNLQLVRTLKQERELMDPISEDLEEIIALKRFMIEEKPYLDPALNLSSLSRMIKMPTKELSLLINHSLNQHFFDFINGFRIQHAMDLLKDPEKKEFTVLEILYEVGFNSKSSFNTSFKKQTRLTPTEYRAKYSKSIL